MVHQPRAEDLKRERLSRTRFSPQFSQERRGTVPDVLGRILVICLGLIAACYSPPQPDCGFVCRRGGECPSDYFCAPDGICHRNGTSATAACAIDARIDSPRPIDAPPPDADVTPPGVFGTSPVDGATGVPTSTVITVQFNEPVGGVDNTSFLVSSGPTAITGLIQPVDPLNWTFQPASLPANATINVELTSAIRDMAGNPLATYMFDFTTAP